MRQKLFEAADTVHSELGSGFTESVYHSALQRELSERGIPFHSEGTIPVMYKGAPVGRRRPDLFIVTEYGLLVVELKANSSSGEAQLDQYLGMTTDDDNLGEIVGGIVIRFNEELEYEYTGIGND
jgi:GxxExxY protein